jgi:hypothetical protein
VKMIRKSIDFETLSNQVLNFMDRIDSSKNSRISMVSIKMNLPYFCATCPYC